MNGADDPRALLKSLSRGANKRLGQHFLARPSVVDRIVRAARVRPGDRVVEVGPGLGILTGALLEAGAQVTAIELDDELADRLEGAHPALTVLRMDAMRADWSEICPGSGWKVVANLPYNVGTPLVMDLVRETGRFQSFTVMLQAEVIDRMAAVPGTRAYGAMSVQLQARADVRPVFGVPKAAFVPPPKVASTVVHIEPFDEPQVGPAGEEAFDRVVKAAFSQRRKTLRNALRPLFGAERADEAIAAVGLDPRIRGEALGLDSFRALADTLYGH